MSNVTKRDITAYELFLGKLTPETIASRDAMVKVSENCFEATGYSLLGHKGAVGVLDNELLKGNHVLSLIFSKVQVAALGPDADCHLKGWLTKDLVAFAKRTKDHTKWLAGNDFSHGGGLPSRLAKVGGQAIADGLFEDFRKIRPYMKGQCESIIKAAK